MIVALALALVACSRQPPSEEPVRSVRLMTVALEGMASEATFAGEVRARVESRLGFRVGGKLVRRPVEVGQRVRPGQVIAQLDAQDFQLANDAMQAQLVAATTNRDLAAAELKRYKDLESRNFVSGAEIERREATLQAASAQVRQIQAQLTAQGNQARYATLTADVAGIVVAVDAEPGQVVAAGTTILRIAQDGPRDVVFAVPEDRIGALALGSPAQVRLWADGSLRTGTVREKAALADPVTRTFQVKLALRGTDAPALGTTVTVVPQALSTRGAQVIKLPTSALKQEGGGSAVWVLDPASMTVRSQPVKIVAADGNQVVVGAGLAPGAQVVTAGVHVLSPGQKVTIYQPRPTAPPASAPVAAR